MRIITKPSDRLTGQEIQQLSRLRLKVGTMFSDLQVDIEYGSWSWVVLGKEGQKIIGWGLLQDYEDGECDFKIYIQRSRRREGIGRKLFKKARTLTEEPIIGHVHDLASENFYHLCQPDKKQYWSYEPERE